MKIAVTSRSFSNNSILVSELSQQFPNIKLNDQGLSLSGKDLIDFLKDAEGAIIGLETINREIVSALPNLKLISKYGVGLNNLDLPALKEAGVKVNWSAGVNRRAVAELALTMALMLVRKVPLALSTTRAQAWKQIIGQQLSEKMIGIIGLGHVGKELVHLLKSFNCEIFAYDIAPDMQFIKENRIQFVPMHDLLKISDVVSLHVPLDTSTQNLIGENELSLMKSTAVIINTSRGGIVNEMDLLSALEAKRIAAAGLDVLSMEPPIDFSLISRDDVIVTPHIGGSASEAILAMGRAAIEGLKT